MYGRCLKCDRPSIIKVYYQGENMTQKRFKQMNGEFAHSFIDTEDASISYICDNENDCKNIVDLLNELSENLTGCNKTAHNALDTIKALNDENKNLKAQLYCEEEGVCNICKHHYLVKDDESEFGYYNSRCKKGHYECARVSLVHCEDFEIKNGDFE